MSKQTNAVTVSTTGIDTGKNTLHMIGLDKMGEIIPREKISGSLANVRMASLCCEHPLGPLHSRGNNSGA
jgi:transposase